MAKQKCSLKDCENLRSLAVSNLTWKDMFNQVQQEGFTVAQTPWVASK